MAPPPFCLSSPSMISSMFSSRSTLKKRKATDIPRLSCFKRARLVDEDNDAETSAQTELATALDFSTDTMSMTDITVPRLLHSRYPLLRDLVTFDYPRKYDAPCTGFAVTHLLSRLFASSNTENIILFGADQRDRIDRIIAVANSHCQYLRHPVMLRFVSLNAHQFDRGLYGSSDSARERLRGIISDLVGLQRHFTTRFVLLIWGLDSYVHTYGSAFGEVLSDSRTEYDITILGTIYTEKGFDLCATDKVTDPEVSITITLTNTEEVPDNELRSLAEMQLPREAVRLLLAPGEVPDVESPVMLPHPARQYGPYFE
ncbi:uncharacterized protein V1518DRAFT_423121 [Limtongia smithiae]|uniref:uncharacterized protein n=1 Tax=Limtongia smithiae TaxID=1125753 RepID=UPI0034CFEA4E